MQLPGTLPPPPLGVLPAWRRDSWMARSIPAQSSSVVPWLCVRVAALLLPASLPASSPGVDGERGRSVAASSNGVSAPPASRLQQISYPSK